MNSIAANPIAIFSGATGPVQSLVHSPDGSMLVGGDTNRMLTLWQEGAIRWQIDLKSRQAKVRAIERIRSLAFSPDGKILYVAAGDRLRAIDVDSGAERWHYEPPRAWCFLIVSPNSIAVTPSSDVVCCLENGAIGVWHSDGRRIKGWTDKDGPRYVGLLPDGKRLVGTDRFSLCVWDLDRQEKLAKVALDDRAYAMACAPGSGLVAIRSLHSIEIWNMDSLVREMMLTIDAGSPLLVASPTEDRFAFTVRGKIQVIDAAGGYLTEIEEDAVSLSMAPEGEHVAAGRSDGSVALWPI